jgi:hypothetical protein
MIIHEWATVGDGYNGIAEGLTSWSLAAGARDEGI